MNGSLNIYDVILRDIFDRKHFRVSYSSYMFISCYFTKKLTARRNFTTILYVPVVSDIT